MFRLRDGVFKALCGEAAAHPREGASILIIDEINRGDVPRIFGELLTVLEKDKRGREVHLPLSGRPFAVPPNVAVIGTMNTADRSIALLDTALRRRFGFIELMPEPELLGGVMVDGVPLAAWLEALNSKIVEKRGADGRNLQVGHAYLLEKGSPVATLAGLARIMRDDIVPLLQEYCYDQDRTLEQILGRNCSESTRDRASEHDLFDSGRDEELLAALREPCQDLAASAAVPTERGGVATRRCGRGGRGGAASSMTEARCSRSPCRNGARRGTGQTNRVCKTGRSTSPDRPLAVKTPPVRFAGSHGVEVRPGDPFLLPRGADSPRSTVDLRIVPKVQSADAAEPAEIRVRLPATASVRRCAAGAGGGRL